MGSAEDVEVVKDEAGDCFVVIGEGRVQLGVLSSSVVSVDAQLLLIALIVELNIGFNIRLRVVRGSVHSVFASL